MVMPSSDTRLDRSRSFQLACVKKAPLLVQCLSDKDFLQGAAPHTRRYARFELTSRYGNTNLHFNLRTHLKDDALIVYVC